MIFSLPEFDNKDVIFIGEGREGKSFEAFIQENAQINSFSFVDQKQGPDYLSKLKTVDFTKTVIVKTPGCPGHLVPAPYTTPTRVFFDCVKQLGAKTIGITGTKGKTTTASLIAHIFTNAGYSIILAGNIGKPMIDYLKDANEHTIFVLELSSFQLAELEVSTDYAVITNLYRDHIDYHQTLENYWEAKRKIMRYMGKQNMVVYNPQTEVVLHWLAESEAQGLAIDPEEKVDMSKSQLIGDHNRLNFLLAKKLASTIGIDNFTISSALTTFKPIAHRLQKVRTVKGVTFIDDAIASQPEASIAGITACVREVGPVGCVMLGGQDRDYEFAELVKLLSTLLIPKLVLFPDTGAKIKSMLPDNYNPEIFETDNMEKAVNWAATNTPSGSICLLSTASPSYSVWKDFEEKGDLFQKAVMNLPS
jgi:UDP-N-acetylmuramoylalanine--D-glutamate ligase